MRHRMSPTFRLGKVDVLMVSIPLSEKTLGFLCEKEIRNMKRGSIIVSTARGPIIDEEAMIRALLDGCMCLFTFGLSGIEFRSSL